MEYDESLAAARGDMEAGQWESARDQLTAALTERESAEASELLGAALWWLGEVRESLRHRERAYVGYRADGRYSAATILALDISVCYLSNLDNEAAARGWVARARRTASASGDGRLDPWLWFLEAYICVDPGRKRQLLERALGAAQESRDVDLELSALADLGLALVAEGEVSHGLALLDEAMAGTLGGEYERLDTVVWASCSMLAACRLVGDLKRAALWCEEADGFAAKYGCPFLQAACRSHYGRVLVATGRWRQAEAELNNALSLSRDLSPSARVEALAGLAELRLRQGMPEQAELLIADAGHDADNGVVAALVLLARGHPDLAVSTLAVPSASLTSRDVAYPPVMATLVEAHLASGDIAAADRIADELDTASTANEHPQAVALAARARGLVATAQHQHEVASQSLRSAAEEFHALHLPFDAGRARLDLARVLAGTDPAAAVVEATRAADQLARLGADLEVARAAALLRELGVPTRSGPRDVGVLTVREREVLALVRQGMTNPQIGARLYISPRTVAHHVSSILTKLGLSTRAEAAAFAVAARLTPTDRAPLG